MLGVSKDTVYQMVRSGEIDALRAGKQYVITRTHLVDYAGSEEVAEDLIRALDDANGDSD
jgi:excisionase family DNA binding protein